MLLKDGNIWKESGVRAKNRNEFIALEFVKKVQFVMVSSILSTPDKSGRGRTLRSASRFPIEHAPTKR